MTTSENNRDIAFYITGGTLPPDAPSYVERQADTDLFTSLLSSEARYVLKSSPMGRSSLGVRTIGRLKQAGVRTAFLDRVEAYILSAMQGHTMVYNGHIDQFGYYGHNH